MPCSLPTELYEEVIGHVARQRRQKYPAHDRYIPRSESKNGALNALMLVNRVFAHYARRHIFAAIQISNAGATSSLRDLDAILRRDPLEDRSCSISPAHQLVKSVTITLYADIASIDPPTLRPLTNIIRKIETHSSALSTFTILNPRSSIDSTQTQSSIANEFVGCVLRLCLLPTLRSLTISGFGSLPVLCISSPHLRFLSLYAVRLGDEFRHMLPLPPTRQTDTLNQARMLNSVIFGRLEHWWHEDTSGFRPVVPTFDYDALVRSLVHLPQQPPSLDTPLFPYLTTLVWRFLQLPVTYDRDSIIGDIAKHAPSLQNLTIVVALRTSAMLHIGNLSRLLNLQSLTLILTSRYSDDSESLQQGARWLQNTVNSVALGLESLALHTDFFLNWSSVETNSGEVAEPWISRDANILEAWTDLADTIARRSVTHVKILPVVRLPYESPKQYSVEWEAYRERSYAKIKEVFQCLTSAKGSYEFIPRYGLPDQGDDRIFVLETDISQMNHIS